MKQAATNHSINKIRLEALTEASDGAYALVSLLRRDDESRIDDDKPLLNDYYRAGVLSALTVCMGQISKYAESEHEQVQQ